MNIEVPEYMMSIFRMGIYPEYISNGDLEIEQFNDCWMFKNSGQTIYVVYNSYFGGICTYDTRSRKKDNRYIKNVINNIKDVIRYCDNIEKIYISNIIIGKQPVLGKYTILVGNLYVNTTKYLARIIHNKCNNDLFIHDYIRIRKGLIKISCDVETTIELVNRISKMSDEELFVRNIQERIIRTHQYECMLEVLLQVECDIVFIFKKDLLVKMLGVDYEGEKYDYRGFEYMKITTSEASSILSSRIRTKSARKL